jgi:hypothetical protein
MVLKCYSFVFYYYSYVYHFNPLTKYLLFVSQTYLICFLLSSPLNLLIPYHLILMLLLNSLRNIHYLYIFVQSAIMLSIHKLITHIYAFELIHLSAFFYFDALIISIASQNLSYHPSTILNHIIIQNINYY